MPLEHSTSKAALSRNIAREKHAHPSMPIKQAVAIAYAVRRRAQKGKR
jgi:hypothetical protein